MMYKIFAFTFFTVSAFFAVVVFSNKDDLLIPSVLAAIVLNIAFLIYVFISFFFKAKYSLAKVVARPITAIQKKFPKFPNLTKFLSTTVVLVYIVFVAALVNLLLAVVSFGFFHNLFSETAKSFFCENNNSSTSVINNVRSLENKIDKINRSMVDLKTRQYFSENPEFYSYFDGRYTHKLVFSEQSTFDSDYTSSFTYAVNFCEKGAPENSCIYVNNVHSAYAKDMKTSVTGIEGDYWEFPYLADGSEDGKTPVIFVTKVFDESEEYGKNGQGVYVFYPTYGGSHTGGYKLLEIVSFSGGFFSDYEVLPKENKIVLTPSRFYPESEEDWDYNDKKFVVSFGRVKSTPENNYTSVSVSVSVVDGEGSVSSVEGL